MIRLPRLPLYIPHIKNKSYKRGLYGTATAATIRSKQAGIEVPFLWNTGTAQCMGGEIGENNMAIENLVQYSGKLTPDERRENAVKAGVASGKVRHQRKQLRQVLNELLPMEVGDEELEQELTL